MFTDPHLHLSYVTTEHDRLVRTVQRDRLIDHLHPWPAPLPPTLPALRRTVGGAVVQLGQRLQGAGAPA